MTQKKIQPCPFCEEYELLKSLRRKLDKTNEFRRRYFAVINERIYRNGCCGSTIFHRHPLRYCPTCGKQLVKQRKKDSE